MNKEEIKTAFLGGDIRQIEIMNAFIERGYKVAAFAFEPDILPKEATFCETACEAMRKAEVVSLPMGGIKKNGSLANMLDLPVFIEKEDFAFLNEGALILTGINCPFLQQSYLECFDVMATADLDSMAMPLAKAAAEGALAEAIKANDELLLGGVALIAGFGRIGRELAWRLSALGMRVKITNRSKRGQAEAALRGYETLPIDLIKENLSDVDLIFNTVPAPIFTKEALSNLNSDTVYLELAGQPGGIPEEAWSIPELKVIRAGGLPGKYAAAYAGRVMARAYCSIVADRLAGREAKS